MQNERRLIYADYGQESVEYLKKHLIVGDSDFLRGYLQGVEALANGLAKLPSVDAVEVVHGRWIEKVDMIASYLAECEETFYECSVCNSPNYGETPYCPNCGAKMDGDGNG